ncbi:MAG TPA: tetratricopeptide repeat protein [Polyangiales bacterium]|nr:tetratricopeptide repeat protein [Polyangiales bacterium]
MRVLLVLVVSLSCLVAAVGVRAQSTESRDARIAEAKKAFSIGTQAYADGEFDTALASFQRAYELTGSPDLLFNVATVSDRMRRDEEALEAYEAYLQARPDSADREHVEGRIEVLRAAIEERRRAEIEADIEARKAAVEAAAKVRAERPLTQHVGPGPGPWITIGMSGAAVLGGAVLLGMGQRNENQVTSAPPGSSYSTFQDVADRGPRLSKAGIALLSVGGAGLVGGVIWQLTGGHEEALPEISIGPTGISVKGRF